MRVTISVGLASTIYIRLVHGILGREITKYTVIYGVYIGVYTVYIYGSGQPYTFASVRTGTCMQIFVHVRMYKLDITCCAC